MMMIMIPKNLIKQLWANSINDDNDDDDDDDNHDDDNHDDDGDDDGTGYSFLLRMWLALTLPYQ